MKFKNLSFIFIAICFFYSCEEEMVMIPDFDLTDTGRVILVEELTGVNCPNCPAGASQLETILTAFEGSVVVVGIHGDLLTQPVTGSVYDFRTEASKDIEDSFLFFGKPSAVINRNNYGEDKPFGLLAQQWNSNILAEVSLPQTVELSIEKTYDAATREMTVKVIAGALVDLNESLHLTVLLTEDNIIDAQKNVSEIIPDYKHKHVLRTVLSDNNLGDLISSGLAANEGFNRSFTYTLPDEDGTWVAENINIVAHIRTDDVVLQAAEVHLVD